MKNATTNKSSKLPIEESKLPYENEINYINTSKTQSENLLTDQGKFLINLIKFYI